MPAAGGHGHPVNPLSTAPHGAETRTPAEEGNSRTGLPVRLRASLELNVVAHGGSDAQEGWCFQDTSRRGNSRETISAMSWDVTPAHRCHF